jgi:hypothetical protein
VKLKNQKHIAVDVLFMGFSMIPLSFRSNLAGRCEREEKIKFTIKSLFLI